MQTFQRVFLQQLLQERHQLLDALRGLGVSLEDGTAPLAIYPSAAALLEDLDRAASEIPADSGMWDKLLGFAANNGGDGVVLRQSA